LHVLHTGSRLQKDQQGTPQMLLAVPGSQMLGIGRAPGRSSFPSALSVKLVGPIARMGLWVPTDPLTSGISGSPCIHGKNYPSVGMNSLASRLHKLKCCDRMTSIIVTQTRPQRHSSMFCPPLRLLRFRYGLYLLPLSPFQPFGRPYSKKVCRYTDCHVDDGCDQYGTQVSALVIAKGASQRIYRTLLLN